MPGHLFDLTNKTRKRLGKGRREEREEGEEGEEGEEKEEKGIIANNHSENINEQDKYTTHKINHEIRKATSKTSIENVDDVEGEEEVKKATGIGKWGRMG